MILEAQNLGLPGRLSGISTALRSGEVTAICGPNGAGKSSLLACLSGLLAPTHGSVTLGGEPLAAMSPRHRARAVGYLPQSPEIAWDVTVEVLVGLGRLPWQGAPLHRTHASTSDDTAAVDEAIAAMDLAQLRHRRVSRLSGGNVPARWSPESSPAGRGGCSPTNRSRTSTLPMPLR